MRSSGLVHRTLVRAALAGRAHAFCLAANRLRQKNLNNCSCFLIIAERPLQQLERATITAGTCELP